MFVPKWKRNKKGDDSRYRARLVVWDEDEEEFMEDTFLPVSDFSAAKLNLCIAL